MDRRQIIAVATSISLVVAAAGAVVAVELGASSPTLEPAASTAEGATPVASPVDGGDLPVETETVYVDVTEPAPAPPAPAPAEAPALVALPPSAPVAPVRASSDDDDRFDDDRFDDEDSWDDEGDESWDDHEDSEDDDSEDGEDD